MCDLRKASWVAMSSCASLNRFVLPKCRLGLAFARAYKNKCATFAEELHSCMWPQNNFTRVPLDWGKCWQPIQLLLASHHGDTLARRVPEDAHTSSPFGTIRGYVDTRKERKNYHDCK